MCVTKPRISIIFQAHILQLDVDDTLIPTSQFCDNDWLGIQGLAMLNIIMIYCFCSCIFLTKAVVVQCIKLIDCYMPLP